MKKGTAIDMKVDYQAIGQRIKQRRKEQKKTQDNLAEALSVSIGYISQLERGVTKISLDTLALIADELQCGLGQLIEGIHPNQPHYLAEEIAHCYNKLEPEQKRILLEIADVLARHSS